MEPSGGRYVLGEDLEASSLAAPSSQGAAPSQEQLAGSSSPTSAKPAIVLADRLRTAVSSVVLGAQRAIDVALCAVLSGVHLLLEDVPGVGKTLLAKSIATALDVEWQRVQGHPDLLPGDVTGVSVYQPVDGRWEIRPGPVFARIVLFDEINRTPPRTQSALLEAMEERQVTIDGQALALPEPHLVIATQNPVSQRGTYPLVEGQLDRFGLATSLGYPDERTEEALSMGQGGAESLALLEPVASAQDWALAQASCKSIHLEPSVVAYGVAICRATRNSPGIRLGASPRASRLLMSVGRARAALGGRDYVIPDDISDVAPYCLAHRLITDDIPPAKALERVLETVRAPRL
jgi:MoxR-like ATPase